MIIIHGMNDSGSAQAEAGRFRGVGGGGLLRPACEVDVAEVVVMMLGTSTRERNVGRNAVAGHGEFPATAAAAATTAGRGR
jgi:hypothetical protein